MKLRSTSDARRWSWVCAWLVTALLLAPRLALAAPHLLQLSANALPPTGPRIALAPLGELSSRDGFMLRSQLEARWWLWLHAQRDADMLVRLRIEELRESGMRAARTPLSTDRRAFTVPHERWTSLSVRRGFHAASLEVGLEGLSSEPMAAMDRRGLRPGALRRAGAVVGARVGSPSWVPSVFDITEHNAVSDKGKRLPSVWPVMVVRGHARRWLGHGQRPVMDVRVRADGALMHVHRPSGIVSQLRGTAMWRHVVGERGQILQVGSFPVAGEPAAPTPQVLYEPISGYEDLARFTAHVMSVSSRAEFRRRQFAVGGFFHATQIDHPRHANRDTWLLAVGPSLAARLKIAGATLLVRWQSARRISNESSPWLHLLTAGV